MTALENASSNRMVAITQRLEGEQRIDRLTRLLEPVARALLADPARADALRGAWLSHSIHPLMTDFPLGMWTSATVLDLLAGREGRPAARRLVGLGVVAAVPTAVTGLAEWGTVQGTRERRTGAVHAVTNSTALLLYVASYAARRRERHAVGVAAALAAGVAATLGGYLGGHLTEVRKVSSYHQGYDEAPAPESMAPDATGP